ncbi:hypothetical protein [Hymenobacter coccineus]|uniref:hypothetical protein n=1 Tax=Hymenobacter coccineus TaxID=1908235 RepID=UPI000F780833|nr:hypothetical protein [Hymenobacter coccineus]
MLVQLGRRLVVVAQDLRFFNRAVQVLDLVVGPEMAQLSETILDAMLGADAVEEVAKGPKLVAQVAELNAVVGQHRAHSVRPLGQHPAQKVGGGHFGGLRPQSGKGHFAGTVNGHKKVLTAFFGLHFHKIDGQLVDGVVLKLLFGHSQPIFSQCFYARVKSGT